MNLEMSLLGWLHSLLSVMALASGLANILMPKGTSLHRRIGQIYVISLIAVCVTSLGVYSLHKFWFPHWTALITLFLIAVAWSAARFKWPRRGWKYIHLTAVLVSYYMLIGGGVNEAFLRVDALHRLGGPSAESVLASPALGLTHFAVMGVFVLLIASYLTVTAVSGKLR